MELLLCPSQISCSDRNKRHFFAFDKHVNSAWKWYLPRWDLKQLTDYNRADKTSKLFIYEVFVLYQGHPAYTSIDMTTKHAYA